MLLTFVGILLCADERDPCYNFIGYWWISDYFSIDGIMEEYLTAKEAEEYRREILVYKADEYIFRNKVYPYIRIKSGYFTNELLQEWSMGSGTPGYDFSDLGVGNLDVIREIILDVAGENGFGRSIFVINSNRIIIKYKGFFFIADRIDHSTTPRSML